MLHLATNNIIGIFSKFDNSLKNGMFKEAVNVLKERNETSHLENFVVGCLLSQMRTKKVMSEN